MLTNSYYGRIINSMCYKEILKENNDIMLSDAKLFVQMPNVFGFIHVLVEIAWIRYINMRPCVF